MLELAIASRSWSPPPFWDIYWLNALLVMLAGVGAYIAVRTLGDIEKQTAIAKTAADAAQVSAKAALLNVQALINAERALIEVDITRPSSDPDKQIANEPAEFAKFPHYGIRITNHGRTVARIVSCEIDSGCVAGEFHRDKLEKGPIRVHMLLAANNSIILMNLGVGMLFDDWPSIDDGTKTGIVRLEVRYEDIIQGEVDPLHPHEPHETSAIFYYAPVWEELRRLPQHNLYT